MKFVNRTRWRSDHLRAIVSRALREEGVPEVMRGRLTVWVRWGRRGVVVPERYHSDKWRWIVLRLPKTLPVTARTVGALARSAIAGMLGRAVFDASEWAETMPLSMRVLRKPTKNEVRMKRFRHAAAMARTWRRKLRLATTMYRKWSRRAGRLHRELNRGLVRKGGA